MPVLIGCYFFVAWLVGWAEQWSAAGRIVMKTNMALGQLLSGIALLLLSKDETTGPRRGVGVILATLLSLIGALTLIQHLFGFDLGIDQLLASEPPRAAATASPNRMGPIGSSSLTLAGIGLLALAYGRRAAASHLGLIICGVNLVPAVGFLYGIRSLYGLPRLTGIAWPSVIALTSLGLGLVMSYTGGGPMGMFLRRDAGGLAFRRLLPVTILAPLLLGFVWVLIEFRGMVQSPTDMGLFVIVLILVFSYLLWLVAVRLSREATMAEAAHDALRESEERLALAASGSRVGIFDRNMKTNEISATEQTVRLLGMELPATTTTVTTTTSTSTTTLSHRYKYRDWAERVHPEDLPRLEAGIDRCMAEHIPFESEYRVVRPDGSIHWLATRALSQYTSQGAPDRLLGIVMDITERKRAEEAVKDSLAEKEVLLRELSHRTKNNMQVICGLMSLQAATTADKNLLDALSDTQDRIRAMALVHEKLHRSGNFASLNFKEYAEDLLKAILLAHHVTGGRVRTETDLEELSVSIDFALPLGLIINELVSNSLKHAFPAPKSGTIFLALRREGERAEMRYRDGGPGMPLDFDLSRIRSLGLKLVENLATLQLRGTMEIRHEPDPEFVFTFGDFTHRAGA